MKRTSGCSAEAGSLAPADAAGRSLEERLRYRFVDSELRTRALTHRSRANEEPGAAENERLEFLGDAVLDLLVSEALMEAHPEAPEGTLSRARATLVNQRALAEHAQRLGLDQEVRLGRSEEGSSGRSKPSILANVFEAVLGAIYLDGGLEPARALVRREFGESLACAAALPLDPKTRLQELLQARGEATPSYRVLDMRGPDHAREFAVDVRVSERVLGQGTGRSKREAEQAAAAAALAEMGA